MTVRSMAPAARASDATRYQVDHKLGEGAAGAVFLARDRETGEQVLGVVDVDADLHA